MGFLYLMERYFAEIGFKLHDWAEGSLPEVAEDPELRAKYEKLRRKMHRMTLRSYKKKFRFPYYKEWDVEKKFPLHEFDSEGYDLEFNKTENQMRAAEAAVERDVKNRQAEIMNANLEKMLAAIFYGFEASGKIQHPLVEHVLQSANTEYFLEITKRLCVVLQADVKKNNGWTERSVVLGRFILELKQKIKDVIVVSSPEPVVFKRLTVLRDIALEAEVFVIETNNTIVAQRKQEKFQQGLQDVLEGGFKQMSAKLGAIERGIIATNCQLSGMNGRLIDILKVNGQILDGIIRNGRLIESLDGKLDDISKQISSMGEMMLDILSEKK